MGTTTILNALFRLVDLHQTVVDCFLKGFARDHCRTRSALLSSIYVGLSGCYIAPIWGYHAVISGE